MPFATANPARSAVEVSRRARIAGSPRAAASFARSVVKQTRLQRRFDRPHELGRAMSCNPRKLRQRRPENVGPFVVGRETDEESRLVEAVGRVLHLIDQRQKFVGVAHPCEDLARRDGELVALCFDLLGAPDERFALGRAGEARSEGGLDHAGQGAG